MKSGLVFGFVLVLLFGSLARAEFQVPKLTGPVVDTGGMLSSATERALDQAIRALHDQGGSQLTVLTVPKLDGLSIEQASIQVTDQWKLGTEKDDNGVLLMLARDERKVRIEVGQGLEGVLTDADSKRIIEEAMLPLFRSGDIDSGVLVGIYQITRKTDPDFDMASYLERSAGQRTRSSRGSSGLKGWIMLLAVIIWLLASIFGGGGRGLRRAAHMGGIGGLGGIGGGGFGGSGRGGGGWGGGGGGFSGGGASGGW